MDERLNPVEELLKLLVPTLRERLSQCEKLPTLAAFFKLANPVLMRMTEVSELATAETDLLQCAVQMMVSMFAELGLVAKQATEEKGAKLPETFKLIHHKSAPV